MTKAQAEFQRRVRELGCVACHVMGHPGTPCEIHHILSGGRQIGEDDVLGLCNPHHRGNVWNKDFVSRHHWRKEFIRRYGSEESLLAWTREQLGVTA